MAVLVTVFLAVALALVGCSSADGDGAPADGVETIRLETFLGKPSEVFLPDIVLDEAARGLSHLQPDGTFETTELDGDSARFLGRPRPDVLAFIVPYRDRTGLCLFEADADGFGLASGCTDAATFNREGLWSAAEDPAGDYSIVVVPEGTEIGDVGTAVVHPSGIAVMVPELRFGIVVQDGRLDL